MKAIFEKVFKVIKRGWFVSLLSLILLAGIVYYLAPIMSEEHSRVIRWGSAISLAFLWLFVQLINLLRQRHKNEKILASLQEVPEVDTLQLEVDQEVDTLNEKLTDALQELQKGKVGKHNGDAKFLYQIPWFILIGPPASGKTTLLKNSSLKMVLSKKFGRDAVSGVGGTRHCDWWFTEQAVLLDTAGRYTTQDSHKERDSKAWFGFLSLLKEKRIRRPINGIIVAISLDDILLSKNTESHAKEIRERVQELYEHLAVKPPVYLVFTKSDLIAGFTEFFDDLDESSRGQVWGTTFTYDNKVIDKPLSILPKELDLLEDTLKDKLLNRLERETDLERRKVIYAFPEQFSSLKNTFIRFTEQVFSTSRYQHDVMLRGVYFTSAEQTGAPIDKLLGNMAHTFGFTQTRLALTRSRGKSYFIDNLLQKVVFPESELASLNPAYEKKKRILQALSIGFASLVTVGAIALWGMSYFTNKSDIDSVSQKTQQLASTLEEYKDDKQLSTSLKILNESAALYLKQDDDVMSDLGLSQQKKLLNDAENTYRQALHARLLPYVMESLEGRLQESGSDAGKLFNNLKAYLILAPNHDQQYSENVTLLHQMVKEDWENNYRQQLSTTEFSQLYIHLERLLERKPSLVRVNLQHDATLIKEAREILAQRDLGELIYLQVKSELHRDPALKEFVLEGNNAPFRHAEKVFERRSGEFLTSGIAGEYTYDGYKAFNSRAKELVTEYLGDDWVVGQVVPDGMDDVYSDVHTRYLEDYQKTWDGYLADLKIKSPESLPEAAKLLDSLSRKDSALRGLLSSVAEETYLSRPIGPEGSKKRAAKEIQREVLKKVGRAGSIAANIVGTEAIDGFVEQKGDDFVSSHFERIRIVVEQDQYQLEEIEKAFDSLRILIQEIEVSAPDDDLNATKKEIRKRMSDLKLLAGKQPIALRTWLHEIRLSIEQLLEGNIDNALNKKWENGAYQDFKKKISNKFPLSSSPRRSIALGDFAEFFGPDGTLDSFFKKNLSTRIDRSSGEWKSVSHLGAPLKPEVIQQFQRAKKIRDAFFPNGERLPSMDFTIQPFDVSDDVQTLKLTIDGVDIAHQAGASIRPQKMKWPGASGASFIKLTVVTHSHGAIDKSANGEWALVDFLTRQGTLTRHKGHQFIAKFQNGEMSVSFLITPTTSENLLTAVRELRKFRCPTSLVQ